MKKPTTDAEALFDLAGQALRIRAWDRAHLLAVLASETWASFVAGRKKQKWCHQWLDFSDFIGFWCDLIVVNNGE